MAIYIPVYKDRGREFMIELRVLGPLELLIRGEMVGLGPRQRILLICLLLANGHVVPASRLAELLWDGTPPRAWSATLRSHVHHLRRALAGANGHDPLATGRVGAEAAYCLRVPVESVDATMFERLVAAGRTALVESRPAAASVLLRDALGMWRGQALSDVAGMTFALPEIARLEELQRAAFMARLEADAHCGLHREIIGTLQGLVARWPDDEGARSLLVTCLLRSGRAADAAKVCREGIELGLDRGLDLARLQALQRDVLTMTLRPIGVSDLPRDRNAASTQS
jgi:DNA-binding SARP family transcriptional activator